MEPYEPVPYDDRHVPLVSPLAAAEAFRDVMRKRRSVRDFSDRDVPSEVIEALVATAATAPSGANRQPWRFVCVRDPALKRRIRLGAEEEERAFYAGRAGKRWLEDLAPLGTDADKSFLEVAPWLVVVFRLAAGDEGEAVYYTQESVGIAVGMFLCAAQHAGLATLTHTPAPMKFLSSILGRPENERPYVLVPVGWAADGCTVPRAALRKKPLDEVMAVL
jgi:iodotyrosine deiodinase